MNVVADPLGDHLAAINPLCPETYSGKGGVATVSAWYGRQSPPSILSVPSSRPAHALTFLPLNRWWMDVAGRT